MGAGHSQQEIALDDVLSDSPVFRSDLARAEDAVDHVEAWLKVNWKASLLIITCHDSSHPRPLSWTM